MPGKPVVRVIRGLHEKADTVYIDGYDECCDG